MTNVNLCVFWGVERLQDQAEQKPLSTTLSQQQNRQKTKVSCGISSTTDDYLFEALNRPATTK